MIRIIIGAWQVMLLFLITAFLLIGCKDETVPKVFEKTIPSDPSRPDIVLIGSEIDGMYLADAAREAGLSVVILDPRDQPGGQLIQGEMLYLDAASSSVLSRPKIARDA